MRIARIGLALALTGCSPTITNGYAIDGDTFVRGGEHFRLARIDAPELPGHCRKGRVCVVGNPYAARQALQEWLWQGVTCDRLKLDYYRRTLVECYARGRNINDALVEDGYAELYRGGK